MNRSRAGFTLLEVIAAVALFAFAVLALTRSGTGSLRNSIESERITRASQLLEMKIAELEVEYQFRIDKEGIKSVIGEKSGAFEKPFEDYRWKATVSENPFTLEGDQLKTVMTSMGVDESLAEVQLEESALILNNLRKALNENLVEVLVEIFWDDFGRERSIPVVTHLIPSKPKIKLTMDRTSS